MIDDKESKLNKAKEIGKKIYSARTKLGFSREKLAEQSNISTNYLYEIETGKKVPNVIIFYNICNALGVTTDLILDFSYESSINEFIIDVKDDYLKLSDKEKKLLKNNIHFLANEKN